MDERDSIVRDEETVSDAQQDVNTEQTSGEAEVKEESVHIETPINEETSQPQDSSKDSQEEPYDEDDELYKYDEDDEELSEAYDETLRKFEEGEIVKGVVIKIDRDEVMVDVGYKSEGYIPLSEFGTNPDGTPKVKVGDVVDVYLLRKEDQDGLVVLSKEIADQKIVWDRIAEAYERNEVIQGKITKRIKGGLKVEIDNVKAFLPASQVELRPVQNFDRYIGKTLDMKVIKLSKRRRNIVLSRRVILEEEREAKRQATLSTLEVGQILLG